MSLDITPPVVVLVHHPDDTTAALALAAELRRAHGIDVWVRGWELAPGDSTVEKIDDGLTRALGGLILLSGRALVGWEKAQYEALIARAAQRGHEGAFVMPVLLDASAEVPPLLAAWASAFSDDIGTIARAILKHAGLNVGDAPALGKLLRTPPTVALELVLRREGPHVVAALGEAEHRSFLPDDEAREVRRKIRGAGTTRDRQSAATYSPLAEVGRRLAEVLAGSVAMELSTALDPRADRGQAVLRVRAEDPDLLALPWEAALLGELGPLALIPRMTLLRVAPSAAHYRPAEVPGPLRILIAVASPTDDLDIEREQELILNALEERTRNNLQRQPAPTRIRVVFIDESLATLDAIRQQLDAEPFHVLHISAHGEPGVLVFEDADGRPAPTPADELGTLLLEVNHPPSLVILSACSTAAPNDEADRLHVAQILLDSGVPAVIAMQGPVGDGYAIELAHHLYRRLALSDAPSPARALAEARRDVERSRVEAARRGARYAAEIPEYGTPVAYAIDQLGDVALYDHTRPHQSMREPPTLITIPGMPQRPVGWVVGHRSFTRALRGDLRERTGVVLTGMGGLGKSSLALRVLAQVVRAGWGVVAIVGVFALTDLAREVVRQLGEQQLLERMSRRGRGWIAALRDTKAEDDTLLGALCGLLAHEPIVLLLDNFEDNLVLQTDGVPVALERGVRPASIRDGTRQILKRLVEACRGRGALFITCRYAIEGIELEQRELPTLHPGAVRRLLFRLAGLHGLPKAERARVVATLGPHPRVLEFVDALVRAEHGDWRAVFADIRRKIEELARNRADEAPNELGLTSEECIASARKLAVEDVLLDALLATLDPEIYRFLLAASVFRRGVPDDAFDFVARAVGLERDERWRRHATRILQARTLLTETGPGGREELNTSRRWRQSWMVHRWTASELHAREPALAVTAHGAAADWWFSSRRLSWDEGHEAICHLLSARRFREASGEALELCSEFGRYNATHAERTLSEYMLEALPDGCFEHALWLGMAANSRAILGDSLGALPQLAEAISRLEEMLDSDPRKVAVLRALSIFYARLGALSDEFGNGEQARRHFENALALCLRASSLESERLDLKVNTVRALQSLGHLHRSFGQGQLARRSFEDAVALARGLVHVEPENARHQRTLALAGDALGDLQADSGNSIQARRSYEESIEILKRICELEPDRVDLQQDLASSFVALGDLHLKLGDAALAKMFLEEAIEIRKQLVALEPQQTSLQSELAIGYENMGSLSRALGDDQTAQRHFERALEIQEQLARREPDRVDLQRHLCVFYDRLGELSIARGREAVARQYFENGLAIRKRLADFDPSKVVMQHDLAGSYTRLGDLCFDQGDLEAARPLYEACLGILSELVSRGDGRIDFQRELATTYGRLGDIHLKLGHKGRTRHFLTLGLEISKRIAVAEPARSDLQHALAVSYAKMGEFCLVVNNAEPARRLFTEGLTLLEQLAGAANPRSDIQRDLSVVYCGLSRCYHASGKLRKALHFLERGLSMQTRLVEGQPDRCDLQRDVAASYTNLGSLHSALNNENLAVGCYERALNLYRNFVERSPDSVPKLIDCIQAYERLASVQPERAAHLLDDAMTLVGNRHFADPMNASVEFWFARVMIRRAECAPEEQANELLKTSYLSLRKLYLADDLEPAFRKAVERLARLLGDTELAERKSRSLRS